MPLVKWKQLPTPSGGDKEKGLFFNKGQHELASTFTARSNEKLKTY